MVQKNTDIKASSRENLLGKYAAPVSASLLIGLLALLIFIPLRSMLFSSIQSNSMLNIIMNLAEIFFAAIILSLFAIGTLKMHLNIARGRKAEMKDLIFPFSHRPDKFIGLTLLIMLIAAACIIPGTILLTMAAPDYKNTQLLACGIAALAAGIIILWFVILGLSMSRFLLLDDSNRTTVQQAVRISWKLMKKHKWQLFVLGWSFIGWIFLSILSFGLAWLWVSQYVSQSTTIFYLELTAGNGRETVEAEKL